MPRTELQHSGKTVYSSRNPFGSIVLGVSQGCVARCFAELCCSVFRSVVLLGCFAVSFCSGVSQCRVARVFRSVVLLGCFAVSFCSGVSQCRFARVFRSVVLLGISQGRVAWRFAGPCCSVFYRTVLLGVSQDRAARLSSTDCVCVTP